MAELDDLHVSLIVSSKNKDPKLVTAALGLEPTHLHLTGEPRTGRLEGARFRNSVWMLDSNRPTDASLEDHLNGFVGRLASKADPLRELVSSGWQAELRCGIFLNGRNGGATLSHDVIAGITSLGVELGLDIYSGEEDDVQTL